MPIKALTIDFWNTLVIASSNGDERRRDRFSCLAGVAGNCRPDLSDADIQRAFREAEVQFNSVWERDYRTLGSDALLRLIWEQLDIEVEDLDHSQAVTRFEEGILAGPPVMTEGVKDALRYASERFELAIISDTMFSPGRVIRRLLDREGVLQYFSSFVFSDETGCSKPDSRAFETALSALGVPASEAAHIGDLRRTDVAGANRAGLYSVLYTGVHRDQFGEAAPRAELTSWNALADVITSLEK